VVDREDPEGIVFAMKEEVVAFEYRCKATGFVGRVRFVRGYGVMADTFATNGITDNLAKAMYPRVLRGEFEITPVLVKPDESSRENWRDSIIFAYREYVSKSVKEHRSK
jgi:hypothetical protein